MCVRVCGQGGGGGEAYKLHLSNQWQTSVVVILSSGLEVQETMQILGPDGWPLIANGEHYADVGTSSGLNFIHTSWLVLGWKHKRIFWVRNTFSKCYGYHKEYPFVVL